MEIRSCVVDNLHGSHRGNDCRHRHADNCQRAGWHRSLQLIFGAYLLTQAILISIYGRLSDLYGRKAVLLFGIGVFLVGSILCGLAWNMISLIAFRVVQGIGASALVPVAQT